MYSIELQAEDTIRYLEHIADNKRAKANFLQDVGVMGANKLKAEAEKIRTFGTLSNSMGWQRGNDEVALTSDVKYFESALETGSKPTGRKPSKAFVAQIAKWGAKKGIPIKSAYMVARKIKLRGSRKYREKSPKQVTRAMKSLQEVLPKLISEFINFYG